MMLNYNVCNLQNTTITLFMYVHTGPVQRQHQHTDRVYSHHRGLRVNYKNKMILAIFSLILVSCDRASET